MPFVSPEPYTLYLDESGDHSLAIIQTRYPVFGLGGVLFESAEHQACAAALSAWKVGFFGTDVCLHLQKITRNLGPFHILKGNDLLRARMFSELQSELDRHDFTLVCAIIDKSRHLLTYGGVAQDPYNMTLEFVMERFCKELESRGSTAGIIAESRSLHQDNALQAHYLSLLASGTRYVSGRDLRARFIGPIEFQPKHHSAIGLQVCDLAIGPMCRDILRLTTPYRVTMTHKLRSDWRGIVTGYGLKTFP